MVFTLASIEQQIAVWEKAGGCHYSESQFRHMLKSEALSADNYLVEFVGQAAYEEAGGVITQDLFEDTVYFDDKALIESLATAKLEVEAAKLVAQGWKWTQIKLATDYEDTKGFDSISLNDKGEFDAAEMALAGCMLVLKRWGDDRISVHKGLVAKADKKALALLKVSGLPDSDAVKTEQAADTNKETEYSSALKEDLKAQRLIIAKHALMSAPSVALDALHFSVCVNAFSNARYGLRPLHMISHNTVCFPKKGELSDNKALGLIEAVKEGFDLSWVTLSTASERFSAFCLLDMKEKDKQVAYATAMMLEPSFDDSHDATESVISALDIKWSNYWRPNAETFFKRISHACLLDIASPLMPEQWRTQAVSLKKKDLAAQVDGLVNGEDKQLNEQQKAYFDSWLPKGF